MSDDETFHAVVQGVHVEILGDMLAATASIGATTLTVVDVADFDEDGGYLRLNGVVMEYLTCDDDLSTITLASALAAAGAIDDKVDVWDKANNVPAELHKAVVDQIDGFDGQATVVISQSVAHALAQDMRAGDSGESVTLTREGAELRLVEVHGRAYSLAALQYLQGGMTTRLAEDDRGIDLIGDSTGAPPGLYIYGSTGSYMALTDDPSAGLLQWLSGISGETAGYLNPGQSGGRPFVDMSTSDTAGVTTAVLTLLAGNPNGTFPEDRAQGLLDGDWHVGGDLYFDGGRKTGDPWPQIITASYPQIDFCVGSLNPSLRVSNPTNVAAKLSTTFGSGGVSVNLQGTQVTIGVQSYNATAATAANTGGLHAADIHSWTGGVSMEDLSGGGTTGASIGNGGRIIRTTSSAQAKENIKPLSLRKAKRALDLIPVTFQLREEKRTKGRHTYPGFTAEQAHEVGMREWVAYDADTKRPYSFRYGELTAAHNMLIKDLYAQTEELRAEVAALRRSIREK